MPNPEVTEDFPVCTSAGNLLEGQNGKESNLTVSVDMYPQASTVGSILACAYLLGMVQGAVRCEKRNKIIDQR